MSALIVSYGETRRECGGQACQHDASPVCPPFNGGEWEEISTAIKRGSSQSIFAGDVTLLVRTKISFQRLWRNTRLHNTTQNAINAAAMLLV